jgi:hypothetical protein
MKNIYDKLSMQKKFNYYYNNVPGKGLCRNNLIYTSLISEDKKVFCQWYHNDSEYHSGKNEVVDPDKMNEKWLREVNYLTQMRNTHSDLVPTIINIDLENRKLFLKIDGPDFWEQAGCDQANFDSVLPDWQEQMLNIINAHKNMGWHKYSMHPSSYFVVDGKLKSINYFFTYHEREPTISIAEVESHIYSTRQDELRKHLDHLGIEWDKKQPWTLLDSLCWESFRTNYPAEFIERVKLCLK